MSVNLTDKITELASINLFERNDKTGELQTGRFVGRPFHLNYHEAHVLINDSWKRKASGIPQGSFLLAYYENEKTVSEALLLRVLEPASLPTDRDVVSSMIEYFKDNLRTAGSESQLDSYTRYEFSFSGLKCRTLGTFYRDANGRMQFGADVENFYSAHNYSVIKPNDDVLERIANFREGETTGKPTDIRVGRVRYSSTRRFQAQEKEVPVYVSPKDFIGTRTALFGMTRTGKSNTAKKVIQATVQINNEAPYTLGQSGNGTPDEHLDPFTDAGVPKHPAGQIIFDINGEYANPNLQDEGTAIFEMYEDRTQRYSVIRKPGFKVMKVNFYRDILSGFELVRSHLIDDTSNYVQSFYSVDLSKPEDYDDNGSAKVRHDRRVAAYLCCLHQAGFNAPDGFTVSFKGNKDLNKLVKDEGLDPSGGITLEEAIDWWTTIWDEYGSHDHFSKYKRKKGREWADEDLKAILAFLTRKKVPGGSGTVEGYRKLRGIRNLHTRTVGKAFEEEIVEELRDGRIIIVDLSQGDPQIQRLYSERICRRIFQDSMDRFIRNKPSNFIQFYFEEAHNLFPKKDDKDLSQIYNRLAKEGAKLNLGLIYATQEVSSISANILKNTQNWFISHLNNDDETKELRKYYDFGDFADSLVRFSASNDKGFVRMKTYSNPFVVPVQVDRFPENVGE
jgi:hypothetical protein